MFRAHTPLGRIMVMGLVMITLALAPSVSGAITAGASPIYSQDRVQAQDCWAVDWQQPSPATACRAYGAPIQTGLPTDVSLQGDFCMNYGPGARAMSRGTTENLSAFFGFQVSSVNEEKVDPTTKTACAVTGENSRWGMVLRGSSSNGFCVPINCGIMHLLNWTNNAIRPFKDNHALAYGARFGVLNDNVGSTVPQGVWHGYLCPALQDTSTAQGLLLCQETWRSDAGADAACHENYSVFGFGICLANGKVTAVMAPGGGSGFREFVGPDPGTNYTMVWTRPQPGTILSTSTGASFRAGNQYGGRNYSVSVNPTQLRQIVAMYNLALQIDQHNGFYRNVLPMSTTLSDWAMTSLQVGIEGNAINGAKTAMIGATTQGLFATSR